jgi:hypothetical protein
MRQFRQHGAGDHDPVIHPGKQPDGFDENQIAKSQVSATTRIISVEETRAIACQFADPQA